MKSPNGFSLIEIIISIFIIGSMLILLQAIIHSDILVKNSKNQGVALAIARNELESLRAGGYTILPQSGSFSNDLLNTLPVGATATFTISTYNEKTKQVSVNVIWMEPGYTASSTVSLSTLITDSGGLP
ncbi:MAG: prepilin-type N-terminal cleavage/methylation domain-containing protein [Candidatus Paceibacterota bacterium]|jgi:prepilin-type N-terminal cleavage/methylation domain-containing protein